MACLNPCSILCSLFLLAVVFLWKPSLIILQSFLASFCVLSLSPSHDWFVESLSLGKHQQSRHLPPQHTLVVCPFLSPPPKAQYHLQPSLAHLATSHSGCSLSCDYKRIVPLVSLGLCYPHTANGSSPILPATTQLVGYLPSYLAVSHYLLALSYLPSQ